jgi:hypothetical protein
MPGHAALCRRNQAKCAAHVRVCDLARKKMRVSTTEDPPASRGGKIWRPYWRGKLCAMRRWAIVSSKYKWISMRCRAGRGRARLFFTLGAVRLGKRDTLLHAAPTRSTELPVRVCDIARLPGLELRYEEDGLRILDRPKFFDDCSRARSRVRARACQFRERQCRSGELGSCGHHATIIKADAYQVA